MISLLPVLFQQPVQAQNYPVQATPQLVPPYSVYLSDYATPGIEKLRLILLQRDISQPVYQLRLIMQLELNGKIIMRTSNSFRPAPITLEAGAPTVISGAELAPTWTAATLILWATPGTSTKKLNRCLREATA